MLSVVVLGVEPSPFFGRASVLWLPSLRIDGTEPKLAFDRRGERRAEERAEDGPFIMRPAFLAVPGFGGSARAGRSR